MSVPWCCALACFMYVCLVQCYGLPLCAGWFGLSAGAYLLLKALLYAAQCIIDADEMTMMDDLVCDDWGGVWGAYHAA